MSPKSAKLDAAKMNLAFPKPGDEVVISGISGRFPESDNLTSLEENLFNKRNLISDDDRRWKSDHPDILQSSGKLNNIEKFDSLFFGIRPEEAQTMDPIGRIILEHAYEAIVDAGVNPEQLRGTRTGVFVGSTFSELERELIYGKNQTSGFGILGCCRSMRANRVSHWLGITGPSYSVDTACSSSLHAIDHAHRAIRSGECDAALVGSSQLCLNPSITMQLGMLGVLSVDGSCKSFDAGGNGYCRSESVCVIFLQKAKDAKRIYANVVYTKTNSDGFKIEGITFPSGPMQTTLLKQFYEECQVSPSSVAYLEAHGTGTTIGDTIELDSIDKVFCPGRSTPLKIGSIKSNLGHTEPTSALCGIAKVIIAMESGYIPPNLHYNSPRENMKGLVEGRLEVVTEPVPWDGGYAAVNSFGFGGANGHILLESNPREKINNGRPNDMLPRLVVLSGRTQEAVGFLLDHLESRPVDVEFLSLFHNIHSIEIPGHLYRGYTILSSQGTPKKTVRDIQYYKSAKRPIWFVFSGIGSPWAGMGEALLKIPIFVNATQKCDAVLKPYGLNIIDILTTKDDKIFESILNSFVGLAVVQIGLVDVLTSLGIAPDNIIGHSTGELGCAYADGCLTAEQVVLSAYYQGLTLIETQTIPHSMSTVGGRGLRDLGRSDTGAGVHNGSGSLSTSGPLNSTNVDCISSRMESFTSVASLNRSTAMTERLSTHLRTVLPAPRPGTQKWLNASLPYERLKTLFSPEFYANNLLANSPLSFEKIFCAVPNDAIVIEITPHGLLQTISRSSLSEKVDSIASADRENTDHMQLLLESIGRMYEVGLHPQLTNLYPGVQYPVSRRTPMISPLLRWDHSKDWFVPKYTTQHEIKTGERVVEISLSDKMYEWMAGHIIDGKNLVPASAYLVMVWETMAIMRGELFENVPVVFEDIKFHRETTIPKEGNVQLNIMVQKGSGRFEVSENETTIVTGFIRASTISTQGGVSIDTLEDHDEPFELTAQDIYKELRLRGYRYDKSFRGLRGVFLGESKGSIAWTGNWVTFIDNMLQLGILRSETRGIFVPASIQMLAINPKMHFVQSRVMPDHNQALTVQMNKDLGIIVSGGIELRGLKTSAVNKEKYAKDPVSEYCEFVAHRDRVKMELRSIISLATHIVLENHLGNQLKSVELVGETEDRSIENLTSPLVQEILSIFPIIQANVNIIRPLNTFCADTLPSTIQVFEPNESTVISDASFVINHGLFTNQNSQTLSRLQKTMKDSAFLLAREPLNTDTDVLAIIESKKFEVILEKRTETELVFLLRKKRELAKVATVIHINNHEFTWLSPLQAAVQAATKIGSCVSNRILLVSERNFNSGLLGLVNCLRKEPGGQYIQGLLIQDLQAPKFSLEDPFYSKQLDLNLALNVLRPNKVWGSYRFSVMESLPSTPVHHVQISQFTYGDLGSLKWVEGRIRPDQRHKDMIEVYYSSLNFRDVIITTGKLAAEDLTKPRKAQKHIIGYEFSGKDVNGQAVMGMVDGGAFSNFCSCDSGLVWAVPENWTLEDAATVPVAYGTAYYALMMEGRMRRGDNVLIHAGSNDVGQAAITLALHEGCEVFTTVGTSQKREFIKNQFPQIDDDHIGNSRNTSFEQLILRKTRGRGVDIVLTSLSEGNLQASVRCLAEGGRFLEIGQYDLAANNSLGMGVFLKGISFHVVSVENLLNASSKKKVQLTAILTDGLKRGVVKPLGRTIFPLDQTEAAFKYMTTGKHVGKVILRIRNENEVGESSLPRGIPRYYCSEDGSNLILGGLGGFGLELADWLVLRGAKKLVLTSRQGITTGYQRMRIKIWESYDVKVIVIVGKDASTREGCEEILREAETLGPVESIFNLALVLRDALLENQTIESFEESFRVKAWTAEQLDKLTRILCPQLKQFVLFSSVTSGRGNAGQTNYGMSNSVMERICEARVAENLPGLTIQWGTIGDVGVLVEMQDDKDFVIGGTMQQPISSCLQQLESFLLQNSPVVSSMVLAEKTAQNNEAATILDRVINIMGIKSLKPVGQNLSLVELGMDSLIAVEIKHTLEREFNVHLTMEHVRALNFSELETLSLKQLEEAGSSEESTNATNNLIDIRLLMEILGSKQINKDIRVRLVTRAEDEGREVFMLPGIEGTHTIFQNLAKKIKFPTTCLQFQTAFTEATSICDMADYLIPHARATSKGREDFTIVGYSFGSMVAIELVRRLESEGFNGRLFLLDGSPDYVKTLINQYRSENTDHQLQLNILLRVMDSLAPHINTKFARKLRNCDTWEEKLEVFDETMPKNENPNYTPEDLRAICSSIYYRLKAGQAYDPSILPPLRTPIILIRPKTQSIRSISEDYGLGLITRNKVEVHYVECDHVTMLDNDFCAAVINRELTEDRPHPNNLCSSSDCASDNHPQNRKLK